MKHKKNMIEVLVRFSVNRVSSIKCHMKDAKELYDIRKKNSEIIDNIHVVSEIHYIDREFARRLANEESSLTALEKEQLRNEVIQDYLNGSKWKP